MRRKESGSDSTQPERLASGDAGGSGVRFRKVVVLCLASGVLGGLGQALIRYACPGAAIPLDMFWYTF